MLRGEAAKAAAAAAVAAEADARAKRAQGSDGGPYGGPDGDVALLDTAGGKGATDPVAVAAAAAGASMSSRSLLREARRLYRRALELNPGNAIAAHGLTALEAKARQKKQKLAASGSGGGGTVKMGKEQSVPLEAPAAYVEALFDS